MKMGACELVKEVRAKKISPKEVLQETFKQIHKSEPEIKAFITLLEEEAYRQAEAIEEKLSRGEDPGPLAGVPVAMKDNILVKGTKTTCASRILENFVAPYDATVTKKLREAGAIFVGKTNMDEFAMGSSTENSAFFTTKNPADKTRVPGGSSGGSAASLATNEVSLATGSDTGGSIRQPAAFCGVLGMKPTYGRVSRFGLVAFASSLDQIGPMAKNISDLALLLQVISGHDPLDATSANVKVPDFSGVFQQDVKGLRIGIPKEYFVAGLDKEVETSVRKAISDLEGLGARTVEVSLPRTEQALAVYYILAPSEASANLARYDGVRYGLRADGAKNLVETYEKTRGEGFGPEVKRRIMLGTYALSSGYYEAYYLKAMKVRELILEDFKSAFEKVDVIATPTTPTPAFKIGEKTQDPLQMYLSDVFTIPCNLAGLPGISIPCGKTKESLPIGLQILGKPFDEAALLRIAYAYTRK